MIKLLQIKIREPMNKEETIIYYLRNEDILNQDILHNYIYSNMNSNYYWSDDFSEEFYINLAKAGFISVSNYFDGQFLLLPELQFEYALLDFRDLHISRKVKKLLNKNEYELTFNENFDELLINLETFHENCWLTNKYIGLMQSLKNNSQKTCNFKILSTELKCKKTNKLIAGEIGYIIGSTYTSLTGFCTKDKRYNNWGTLQLVLLAFYLQKQNFSFWNLGHAAMPYKLKLGAKVYTREDFLKRWLRDSNK